MRHSFTIQEKSNLSENCMQRCYFVACDKSYGENCQYPCSPLCINQTCDPFNGTCLTSCKDKSYGDKCIAGTSLTIYYFEYLCKKCFNTTSVCE